jgi:hypothetical protein
MKIKLNTDFQFFDATFLIILCVLLMLGACKGSNDKDSSQSGGQTEKSIKISKDIDPCGLITKAEAGEALGGTLGELERPAEANIPPYLSTCRYVAQRGQKVAVMTVMVRRGYSVDESRLGFDSAKEQFSDAQGVQGIGEDAFWSSNQLNILQGNVYLIIGGDLQLDSAKKLGQRALDRLK